MHKPFFFANRESLKLYRDILRATRRFTWQNEQGKPWRRVLQHNARKEFEQARYEADATLVARLLLVGRDSLNQVTDRFIKTAAKMNNDIESTRNDR